MEAAGDLGPAVMLLSEQLVRMESITGGPGETAKGRWLLGWLAEHCSAPGLELQAIAMGSPAAGSTDAAAPCSVLAYLPPREGSALASASAKGNCLLLLGHYDTVGLEPYGDLAGAALDSMALKTAYSRHPDVQVAQHAASADWHFGRGWLDMQGGVASALLAFAHFARAGGLPAGLVLLLCPDEERDSSGVRSAIPALLELQARHGLRFGGLLNTDYCIPGELRQRSGRSRRRPATAGTELDLRGVLYSGSIGKLLLGISVFGLPTHAAEPFAGLNSAALAGQLAARLEQDRALQLTVQGQALPPPSVLELRSRRERYDVMTVQCSELYLNCFHGGGDMQRLWRRLLARVRQHCRDYLRQLRAQERAFVLRSGAAGPLSSHHPEVLDYAQLVALAGQAGNTKESEPLARDPQADPAAGAPDLRELALARVRELEARLPRGRARVVLSLLPPFYPAPRPQPPQLARDKALARRLGLRWQPLYPFISDMSFFGFDRLFADWPELNAPLWWSADELELYRRAAMPVCNIGPLGLGAHSAVERVYTPQLEELPATLIAALEVMAQS